MANESRTKETEAENEGNRLQQQKQNEDDNQLVNETKKRAYKINDQKGDGESASLKNNVDIEMNELNASEQTRSNAAKTNTGSSTARSANAAKAGSQQRTKSSGDKCETLCHKIRNLLDLNLKFKETIQ